MMIATSGLPRLGQSTIVRERLQRWMQAYASAPVRLIAGPSGSGKTTMLVHYLNSIPAAAAYCSLPRDCMPSDLYRTVARSLEVAEPPKTYDELLALLRLQGAVVVAIDDLDNATAETAAQIASLIEDVDPQVSLIYSARSREAVQSRVLVARGIAGLCDARRLFFTKEEALGLANAMGVQTSDTAVARLLNDTDGWAMAVANTIRKAAAEGESIDRALVLWKKEQHTFLRDFLSSALQLETEQERKTFWRLYSGDGENDPERLRALEQRGLFMIEEPPGHLRLFRALLPMATKAESTVSPSRVAPMMVKMLRNFEASIQGKPVHWVRRRDQEIVKYLLLKPDGRAERDEIAQVFWPAADRHLATQSVRTVCSTIRRALAEVVGANAVDAYFRTVPALQLDLENVVSDVRRFNLHVKDAQAALQRGDDAAAEMHLRSAYKLYSGALLEFEGTKSWYAAHAAALEERYAYTLERLAELAEKRNDETAARAYAALPRTSAQKRGA